MARIFISYRRDDSGYVADILEGKLQERFGTDSVFLDIDSIPLGVDFRDHITDAVGQCHVVLVLIGDFWLDARNEKGSRRLDESTDFVRIEIEAALDRGIPVIPVLVGKAVVPRGSELPPSIEKLAYRNAAEVRSGRDFNTHLQRLIQGLSPLVDTAPSPLPSPQPRPLQPTLMQPAGEKQKVVLTEGDVLEWLAKRELLNQRGLWLGPDAQLYGRKQLNRAIFLYSLSDTDVRDLQLAFDPNLDETAPLPLLLTTHEIFWQWEGIGKSARYRDIDSVEVKVDGYGIALLCIDGDEVLRGDLADPIGELLLRVIQRPLSPNGRSKHS